MGEEGTRQVEPETTGVYLTTNGQVLTIRLIRTIGKVSMEVEYPIKKKDSAGLSKPLKYIEGLLDDRTLFELPIFIDQSELARLVLKELFKKYDLGALMYKAKINDYSKIQINPEIAKQTPVFISPSMESYYPFIKYFDSLMK